MSKFDGFTREEVGSIYVVPKERFVVSLIVGYGEEDGVKTPEDAAHYALRLTNDDGQEGTTWFVFDRKEKTMHRFEQGQFADLPDDYL